MSQITLNQLGAITTHRCYGYKADSELQTPKLSEYL